MHLVAVLGVLGAPPPFAATLKSGDFVLADRSTYGSCRIVVLDHATFAPTVVSAGPLVTNPAHVAIDVQGRIFVTDYYQGLVAIDAVTGSQSVFASIAQLGGTPSGVLTTPDGKLYVSVDQPGRVLRLDPVTGVPATVTSGGLLSFPAALASGPDGMLYVAENVQPLRGSIVRVDPASGGQALIASSLVSDFRYPIDIAVSNGIAYTAENGFNDGRGGCFEESQLTDGATVLSSLSSYCRSKGIAVASDGMIAYSDCIPVNQVCSTFVVGRNTDGAVVTGMGGPLGAVPEGLNPTPAKTSTWGHLKSIYR
jgi:hypothetical protein